VQTLAVRETAGEPYAESEAEADPRSEDTETEELGDEIALMAAHLHAYKRRYLGLLAEFDRRRGWEPGGAAPGLSARGPEHPVRAPLAGGEWSRRARTLGAGGRDESFR